ncbi:MAG TPA: ATPase domain-containing protein, partial [Thermoplasmata archaeon]|nr:ATPase domain-containing protein [Thermoplasmata archaeon]
MEGSADGATSVAEPAASRASELARLLGVSADGARRLVGAGHESPEAARALSADELDRLGLAPADRDAVLHPASAASAGPGADPPASANPDQIVERWVGSVSKVEKARRPRFAPSGKASADVLRRWVDGDDRAMEDWIQSSEGVPTPTLPSSVPAPGREAGPPGAPSEPGVAPSVLDREETVVRWLTGLLDRVKSEQFDPASMIQEVQELQRQLYDERSRRKQLEDQVEHVKRGSIAVIKYVRSREAKEREAALHAQEEELARLRQRLTVLEGAVGPSPAAVGPPPSPQGASGVAASVAPPSEDEERLREEWAAREQQYIDRETELRRRVVHLEGEARRLSAEADQARGQAASQPTGALDADVARRLADATQRERDLVARENELRTKFEEIRIAAEELERRRSPLEFKEKELSTYDQQLETRRRALDLEARRLEETRRELGVGKVASPSETDRLDALRQELAKKEDELRGRESLLAERTRDLERLATGAATAEADRLHAESVADAAPARVRSGVRRLDDLLFGGYLAGTQLLINGPAHSGKDVLARLFSVEGLRQGIPSIWVVTDKTYSQVREDLLQLYPGTSEAERKGLLRFVDLYSLAVGASGSASGVRFLSSTDRGVLDQLSKAVDGYAEQLKEQFRTYRLIFESVSTVTAYLDTSATFRFLQPFVGRRKLDGAVGYYELESGMHSEADLETLEHMVDGSINLKIEQMKTFLAVRGLGEAQA